MVFTTSPDPLGSWVIDIGKTDDCERRLQEHENKTPVKKMFVFTDYESIDKLSYCETHLIKEYKNNYHIRCTNEKNDDPTVHHLYLLIWEEEI